MRLLRSLAFGLALGFILCSLRWLPLVCAQSSLPMQSNVKTPNLTFTTIDVPGAGYTAVLGINTAGDMVGDYGQSTSQDAHGFKYSSGVFTYFDSPDGQGFTIPGAINDSGLIVGTAGQNPIVGFLYDGASFTTLRDGNDSATYTNGINNAGMVVGGAGTLYSTTGFVMRTNRYKQLNVPGSYVYVYGQGINNFGQIVGWADEDAFMCRYTKSSISAWPS